MFTDTCCQIRWNSTFFADIVLTQLMVVKGAQSGHLKCKNSANFDESISTMPHITKRVVDAAKPMESRYIKWDDQVRGFGLLILPSGIKSFIVQYRNAHGRSRRQTLGRYGSLTVDQARGMAQQIVAEVAKGHDPLAERQVTRAAPCMSDLMDRYLTDHVDKHNGKRMQVEARRLTRRHINPTFGNLKVSGVTRSDVARLHRAMSETPRQANLVLSILSKAFALAELWGMRPAMSNPVRGIKRYKENERERFLTAEELSRLGITLATAENEGLPWNISATDSKHLPKNVGERRSHPNPSALSVIRLLLFTGARLSEIISLEWDHVDLEKGMLALPSRKGGGRKPHPASSEVVAIVREINKHSSSPWLFPREANPERHISAEVIESTWQKIRHHADLKDVRLHDLRHTVGTYASQAGGNAFLISHLLRHRNITITNRYVNPDVDPIREISEIIGNRIQSGLRGQS